MTISTVIVVPETLSATCNALATQHFDAEGGELTFIQPLVTPPDLTTITHRWCAAIFSPAKRELLAQLVQQLPGVIAHDVDIDANPAAPFAFLAQNGLARPQPMFTTP